MITILNVSNPVYANAAGTIINLTLDTVEHGVIEFSANAGDPVEPAPTLYAAALTGEFGVISPFVANMANIKATAIAAIDAAAGEARARYITTAAGQDTTYLLKAADADAYKVAGYPDAQITNYPWVLAKAKAMVATPAAADYQAAADLIIATRNMWVTTGVQIEEARERGKAAVTAAADTAGVEAALVAAVGELGTL